MKPQQTLGGQARLKRIELVDGTILGDSKPKGDKTKKDDLKLRTSPLH